MFTSQYTGKQIEEAVGKVIEGKVGGMTPITYNDLVELRKNSQLTPGMQYRITDYVTMTSQSNTESAGHRFDIIVTADSKNVLNENARAIQHDGCDDFKDNNLAAWELKYSLTNDDNRYRWGKEGIRVESKYIENRDIGEITSIYSNSSIKIHGKIYFINTDKKYTIESESYYKIINALSYFVPVDYKVGDTMISYTFAENIPSSFITNEKITVDDTDFFKLDEQHYNIYYVNKDYNNDKNIYIIELYDYGSITEINGDEITFNAYDPDINDDITKTDTVDKTIITINNLNYYKFKNSSYYIPVNYEVGSNVTYIGKSAEMFNISDIKDFSSCSKGVIYYMKDEFNNECPYDFKNIKFLNVFDEEFYTFDSDCHDNTILPHTYENMYSLNFITLGRSCYNNIFGNNCYNSSFDEGCYSNIFGNYCYNNIFGNYCYGNIFGNNCYGNGFGNSCRTSIFGNYCSNNIFGNNNYCNGFGNSCTYNSLGYNCSNNIFGNTCSNNIFGNICSNNSFGNSCSSNSFGNSCSYNSFGEGCSSNSFGNSCVYIRFGNDRTIKSYFRNIIVDSGNRFININCDKTTSNTLCFQNVRICLGYNNTNEFKYKTITSLDINQNFETLYKPKDSKSLE